MKVKVFATLRQLVGAKKEVDVKAKAGDTVRDVLDQLVASYPDLQARMFDEEGNLRRSVKVLVKGRSIEFKDGLDTVLEEGDHLALFPPVGGG